jgi:uncharacterized membrane protein YedE/YeeE
MKQIVYFVVGLLFGFVLVKAEIVSWFRIQEMFRFQSFHMYGIMGSAWVVAMISVFLMKRFKLKTLVGQPIRTEPKKFNWGYIYGGLIFGFGWAMTGACPGPLYALIGSGTLVFVVVLFSALLGTFVYGLIKDKIPH